MEKTYLVVKKLYLEKENINFYKLGRKCIQMQVHEIITVLI